MTDASDRYPEIFRPHATRNRVLYDRLLDTGFTKNEASVIMRLIRETT